MLKSKGALLAARCTMALSAAAISLVVGCGGGEKTYPVAGKIVWKDGQPATQLAGATVIFRNTDKTSRPVNILGEVQADATFKVRTGNDREGAPEGEYLVAVMPKLDPSARNMVPSWMDQRFLDYRTSGLKATVEAKENNVTLELERRK